MHTNGVLYKYWYSLDVQFVQLRFPSLYVLYTVQYCICSDLKTQYHNLLNFLFCKLQYCTYSIPLYRAKRFSLMIVKEVWHHSVTITVDKKCRVISKQTWTFLYMNDCKFASGWTKTYSWWRVMLPGPHHYSFVLSSYLLQVKSVYMDVWYSYHRRKMETKGKATVVASGCGENLFNSLPR